MEKTPHLQLPQCSYERLKKVILAYAQLGEASNDEIARRVFPEAKIGKQQASLLNSALRQMGILSGNHHDRKRELQPLGSMLAAKLQDGDSAEIKRAWGRILPQYRLVQNLYFGLPGKSLYPNDLRWHIFEAAGYSHRVEHMERGLTAIIDILIDAGYIQLRKGRYQVTREFDKAMMGNAAHHPAPNRRQIFISCGQQGTEKALGSQIKALIDQNFAFEGYFAEDQQSLEAVTKNVFSQLDSSCALIAVMHRRHRLIDSRGNIDTNTFRGSVWVEQEIAIAAFLRQTLGRALPVKAYIQNGIGLEGVREKITLNAKSFESDEDVLADLEKSLSSWLKEIPVVGARPSHA